MSGARVSRFYYGWVIVGVSLLINVASSPLNAGVFSFFVAPMSDDLGWSRSALAWALTWRLLVAGVSAPFLGALLDRFGPRIPGTVLGLIGGLTVVGFALVHDIWVFYLIAALSGLAGFGAPGGQLLTTVPVAKWFHANRGRALAIATVGLPAGSAVLFLVSQQLIDALGWRMAWAALGCFVVVLIVPACLIFMRKDPESMGLLPDGVPAASGPELVDVTFGDSLEEPPILPEATAATATTEDWTTSQVLHDRTLWLILASMALSGMVLPGTVVYRVSFWEDVGLSPGTVALGTALDPITVTISSLFFGFMADRVATRYLGFIGGAGVAVAMLPMAFAFNSVFMLFAYNILWGSCIGAFVTCNNIIWPNYYGLRFLGTIRGVVFPVSVVAAAVSTPIFAALLDVAPDERYVWAGTSVAFLASGLLLLIARPPRRRIATEPALVTAGIT